MIEADYQSKSRITNYSDPYLEHLSSIWEPKKEYIDKDLWVIRNFLSQEEIDWIMSEVNNPDNWYTTMRSPYKNILNKYLDLVPEYSEDGVLVSQFLDNPKRKKIPHFHTKDGINNRLMSVLPKKFYGTTTVQTFLSVREDDEEMVKLCKERQAKEKDASFDWHYEATEANEALINKLTGAFSLYLNNDFQGGELLFKHKPHIVIKAEPGMLINIPLTEEFTHKVTFVYGGDRHTLYGTSFLDPDHFKSDITNC